MVTILQEPGETSRDRALSRGSVHGSILIHVHSFKLYCMIKHFLEDFFESAWYPIVGIRCLIFNLLYGTNSVTTIDWKTFLPYCSHKLITQYIQLRSSQPAFISANYFSQWLYNPTEESRETENNSDMDVGHLSHVSHVHVMCHIMHSNNEKHDDKSVNRLFIFQSSNIQFIYLARISSCGDTMWFEPEEREGTIQLCPCLDKKALKVLMFNSILTFPHRRNK